MKWVMAVRIAMKEKNRRPDEMTKWKLAAGLGDKSLIQLLPL
jgi:hypothetical protein